MSFLDGPLDAARGFAGDVRDFGGDVVNTVEDFGGDVIDVVEDGGEVAMGGLRFGADYTRANLDRLLDGGTAALSFGGGIFDRFTHPGDPTPPAAQGLDFSETKNASNLAYDANLGETYRFPDGTQWEVVDVLDDQDTGFRAIALRSKAPNDDRVIVAYAGSREFADWKANFGQGLGLPTAQYDQAADFAAKWQDLEGSNVILTGHSLGGGLASYAAIKTGLHATGVNSAPLALNHLGINPVDWLHITQYYVPGEALSVWNEANPLDVRPGFNIAVSGRHWILDPRSVGSNHGLENVAPDIPLAVEVE